MAGEIRTLLALSRFGWGVSSGEIATLKGGEMDWLEQQVKTGIDQGWRQTQTAKEIFEEVIGRKNKAKKAEVRTDAKMPRNRVAVAAQRAHANRLAYARDTQSPFLDRLSAFWANHFAISTNGQILKGLAPLYESEAIRPFVLGNFGDMLLAVAQHPAMLYYLDNHRSIGPNSPAGKRQGKGLNENLAREILELHTLGTDGGYSQSDVTAFANCLTGWTIDLLGRKGAAGAFIFNPNWHEPGDQVVLGKPRTKKGLEQARSVLTEISVHPSTARHIAQKLARHFIADNPPKSLVSKLEKRFVETKGDLREVSLALIQAEESWTPERQRFLPPLAFVVALGKALPNGLKPAQMLGSARQMGQPLWAPNSPEGYPDDNASWLSANAMKLRLNLVDSVAAKADVGNNISDFATRLFGDTLSAETAKTIARAESSRQGLTLLLMSPEFQRR